MQQIKQADKVPAPGCGKTPPGSRDYTRCERSSLTVEIDGRLWRLDRVADLDSLWDELDEDYFVRDERIPYWVEFWPASILVCRWLIRNAPAVRAKPCLDVGCGLGLTAIVGSWLGAKVTAMDYEWPALYYTRENARKNLVPVPNLVQADWRTPAFRPGSFDYVWAGDVFFERRSFVPLADLFARVVSDGGAVIVGEANRQVSRAVWQDLEKAGWNVERIDRDKVPFAGGRATINLWRLTRTP